jgi:hypothetical protein
MGDLNPSKMPSKKKIVRKDNPNDVEVYKKGGSTGLYANIHAKQKRGGKMRKPGQKGAPSAQDFINSAKTAKK